MSALGQDGTINEESLSQSELGRVYGPLREQVTDSIHRQETVLANIQVRSPEKDFCYYPCQNKKVWW